jgi:antitoxin component YwqK of YwqJK toxin-antitoxin module
MESEREWSEGTLQGQIREWYPNGSLKTHEVWRSGVREKIIVADGRKLTDRTRDFLFGSRLRANMGVANGGRSGGAGGGLDWLSLDGGSGSRPRNPWRG